MFIVVAIATADCFSWFFDCSGSLFTDGTLLPMCVCVHVFFGPGNGFPMATNIVLVVLLGVVVIRFSKY